MGVGIIGTGFGRTVAETFERTDGCQVIDVMSPRDPSAAARLCERTDVDLVAVHSPPHLHRRDVEIAVQHGRHVICDKPFGHTLGDAQAMVAAAASASTLALTTFELRFESWRTTITALLAHGVLGDLRSVLWQESSSSWTTAPSGWQSVRSLGGGWLGASGSHTLDTLRRWAGDLTVRGADVVPLDDGPDSADGGVRVIAEGTSGARCTLVTLGNDAHASGRHVLVHADGGFLTSDGYSTVELHGAEWPDEVLRPAPVTRRFETALITWCAAVRDAVRTGDPSGVATFDDALRTARVLHDVRQASDRALDGERAR